MKRGGRESGVLPESKADGGSPTGQQAAANPAALTYCEMCGHPSDDGDRIRALEAELERLKEAVE